MNLDREIEDLLAVDHSPEFLAKVRRRIATEPPPAAAWFSWKVLPIAAGAATVVIAVLLWPASEPLRVAPAAQSTEPVAEPVARTLASPPARSPAPPIAPSHPLAPVGQRRAGPRTRLRPLGYGVQALARGTGATPVLVSDRESHAFDVLLARVEEGSLPDMGDSLTASNATGPPWIEIVPVAIDPIAQAEGE